MELPSELANELGFEPVEESKLTPGQREAVAAFRTNHPALKVVRIEMPLMVVCLFDPESGAPSSLVPLE